jgi:dTMP kinase
VSLFFTFDGIDGAGKTTQIDSFCQWLEEYDLEVVRCRDPGSTPLGEMLRKVLLQKDDIAIGMRSETLLYMAARAQLVEQQIRPALQAGHVVVSDRYLLANVAYQGYGGGLDPEHIWSLGQFATGGLMPDCTFVLDLDAQRAIERLTRPADRLEQRGVEFLERVREGLLVEARRHKGILVLDADRPADQIQHDIRAQAARMLQERNSAA